VCEAVDKWLKEKGGLGRVYAVQAQSVPSIKAAIRQAFAAKEKTQ
jgi:hypothetical protein